MSLLEVKNLTVSFEGRTVFKDLSFNVEKGDYLCILGENGSGKTTLMRCILGFPVKHEGIINYNGFSRREIGWLPQRSESKTDFPASVGEVVMSGFAGRNRTGLFYSSAQKRQARANMELMEISELKNRSFKELSGGQQQRVLLCRALCAADSILLLDEPVTGLDIKHQLRFMALAKEISAERCVVAVLHDIELAARFAQRIIVIKDGRVFADGSPAEVLTADVLKEVWEIDGSISYISGQPFLKLSGDGL